MLNLRNRSPVLKFRKLTVINPAMKFRSNPALPTVLNDWKGNPLDDNGCFLHPDYPFELGWMDVLKWKLFTKNPYQEKKKNDPWRATVVKDSGFLRHDRDVFVWLGHASFFFRLNGINILIDPVFGKLAPLTPRFSELPVSAEKFQNIDLVLLTHDHRDHCDEASLKFLLKNNPKAKIITGLNMQPVVSAWSNGCPIVEMGWFQLVDNESLGLKIFYLPTRHWCRRWLTDTNKRLWGAFVLQTDSTTIYFGADSGYGNHYKQAAALFPKIDYAFLGIGAFAPEWFMHPNHMSPADAWQAFHDLGAARMIPMHYGTFDLSDEPLGEPERFLKSISAGSEAVEFLTIGKAREVKTELVK